MELLKRQLDEVKIPGPNDKIYKDECMFSFDTPETDTGLYVSLASFYGFGCYYVELYQRKTNHCVYLHIEREKREVSSPPQTDGPEKKITRLAIGVEGGFDPESSRKKYEFVDKYTVVVLPQFAQIPWPNPEIPQIVQDSVNAILAAQPAGKVAELEALAGTWDGEQRIISVHANDLKQLDNGKRIPTSGWQCEKCDLRENLWLNLTDGSILCGRRFHDGSGGNNHAVEHYNETKYPLAVKLGTITKDGKADVFSYSEDEMVEDPKLGEHLSHFGINSASMEKTDKSMVELELDLNQKLGEWADLQENTGKLQPIYGPGYTGMVNLGNSCYLNSVMQMLFIVPDFIQRFYTEAPVTFEECAPDPANNFEIQMSKLCMGLLSGRYSEPPQPGSPVDADPPGISPGMFKALIGRGHADFSSKRQQDAQEFLSHIITMLERNSRTKADPSQAFKFKLEERVECCSSRNVKYTYRPDWLLPLNIPLEAAINKEEVSAYEARKREAEAQGKKLGPEELVRPRIKLFSCLEAFTQVETIEQFYSTAVKAKTTARKTTRLATFPDYLVIQLKKFTLREDWVPIKLDVAMEMPDILDISPLRGAGPQPEEVPLPELVGSPPPAPAMDQQVIDELLVMGFPLEAIKRAIFFTHNSGLELATAWIMEHISDSDFTDPFVPPGMIGKCTETTEFTPDPDALQFIMGMGFTSDQAVKALKATNNNPERAADWIFSHQDELNSEPAPVPEFRDGGSKYRLVAFVSHMGQSSMVGHYVCHILREGRWVIYNDSKVHLSEHPPKELGYIYLYERLK